MESKNPAAPDSVRLALCGAPPAFNYNPYPQKKSIFNFKKALKI